MTNILRPAQREAMLTAWGWGVDNFGVVLLSSSYTYSSAHDFVDDLSVGVLGTTALLTSMTVTDGAAGSDVPIASGISGTVTQAWLYRDTGVDATSDLIAYYNLLATGQPLSVVATGQDYYVRVAGGIWFRI